MNDTKNRYVTVLWEARAKAGREAEMKAFMTAAVTPSRNDPGNIDYEAHELEGQPGTFIIYERWEKPGCPRSAPERSPDAGTGAPALRTDGRNH
ncbi:putative quinol monooxygenase [Paenibacillus rhizoplanae]